MKLSPKLLVIIGGIIVVLIIGYVVSQSGNNDTINTSVPTNTDSNVDTESNSDEAASETDTQLASCPYPTRTIPELAMTYGVPDGWIAELENGTLAIMEDDTNTTTAFIYTAKLERDLTATEFLQSFGDVFRSTIEDAGGTFSLGSPTVSDGGTASADASATVTEGDLRGVFTVLKDTGFVTFTAYWAPTAELAEKESQLQDILNCFSRSTALTDAQLTAAGEAADQQATGDASANPWGALTARSDGNFTFSAPANWASLPTSSGDTTSLALDAPTGDASVVFISNLGRYGAADPQEFAVTTMSVTYGIQATLSNPQTLDGGVSAWDFTGTFNNKRVAGAVSVLIAPYQTFFAHYLGIQITNENVWTEYAPTLNQIQSSIRLTDAATQVNSLPALPNYSTDTVFGDSVTSSQKYKQEVSDKSADNWADAMRGYETVESPSTGDTYDAPLNSYNPTGPDGPGYYRELPGGGMEQLTPVE